jgi:predicted TIM-barrel fold metal-dependent hydrolase
MSKPDRPHLDRRQLLLALGAASAVSAESARAQEASPTPAPRQPVPVPVDHERFFVIDAVAHPYDQSKHHPTREAVNAINTAWSYHRLTNPPEYTLTPAEWARNWTPEEFIDLMLLESETDLVCAHSVPNLGYEVGPSDWWRGGIVSNEKGAYLKNHYPDRIVWYGSLNMFDPLPLSYEHIDRLADLGADGIKLYPTQFNPGDGRVEGWVMDDERLAYPVFEHARKRGFRHIAVHKLLEYQGPSTPASGVGDIAGAAKHFPDLTFHAVHAGWLLLDETLRLMNTHPNITATMEGPFLWQMYDPDRFSEIMAAFINNVGPDRLLYSSAATNPHPRWLIEKFIAYQPPEWAGFSLSDDVKAKILGGNFARLHGIDIPARRGRISDDRFARVRAQHGLREPWTGVRQAGVARLT